METIEGALTTNAFVVVLPVAPTPSLRTEIFSNDPPAQPVAAVLASPEAVQACARIGVSAAASSGAAGRAFTVAWRLGASSHAPLAQQLEAKVAAATAQLGDKGRKAWLSRISFEISQTELFAAVEVVKASLGASYYTTPIQPPNRNGMNG